MQGHDSSSSAGPLSKRLPVGPREFSALQLCRTPLAALPPHPPHVRLDDLLLPAARVDAPLVHGERGGVVVEQVVRLRQVEHDARVERPPLMLLGEQRQIQLRARRSAARRECSGPCAVCPIVADRSCAATLL